MRRCTLPLVDAASSSPLNLVTSSAVCFVAQRTQQNSATRRGGRGGGRGAYFKPRGGGGLRTLPTEMGNPSHDDPNDLIHRVTAQSGEAYGKSSPGSKPSGGDLLDILEGDNADDDMSRSSYQYGRNLGGTSSNFNAVQPSSQRVHDGTTTDRLKRREVDRIIRKNTERKEERDTAVVRERLLPEVPRVLCDDLTPLTSYSGLWMTIPMGPTTSFSTLKSAPATPEYIWRFLAGGDGASPNELEEVTKKAKSQMRRLEEAYDPIATGHDDPQYYYNGPAGSAPSNHLRVQVERLPLPQADLRQLMEVLCELRGFQFKADDITPLSMTAIEEFCKGEWQRGELGSDLEFQGSSSSNGRLKEPAYMFTVTTDTFGWKKVRTFLASRFNVTSKSFYFLGRGSGNNGLTSVVICRPGSVTRKQLLLLNVMLTSGDLIRVGNITEIPNTLYTPPTSTTTSTTSHGGRVLQVPSYDLTSGSIPLYGGARLLADSLASNVLLGSGVPLPDNLLLPSNNTTSKHQQHHHTLPTPSTPSHTVTSSLEGEDSTAPMHVSDVCRRLVEGLGVSSLGDVMLYEEQVCLHNVLGTKAEITSVLGALQDLGSAVYFNLASWEVACAKGVLGGDAEGALWDAISALVPPELRTLVTTGTKDLRGARNLLSKIPTTGILHRGLVSYVNSRGNAMNAVTKLSEYVTGGKLRDVLVKHIHNQLVSARLRMPRTVLVGDFVRTQTQPDKKGSTSGMSMEDDEELSGGVDTTSATAGTTLLLLGSKIGSGAVRLVTSEEEAKQYSFADVVIPHRECCSTADTTNPIFKGSFAPQSLIATLHDGATAINTKAYVAQLLVSEGITTVFSTDRIQNDTMRDLIQKKAQQHDSAALVSYFPLVNVPDIQWAVVDDSIGARSPDGHVTYTPPAAARGLQALESAAVSPLSVTSKVLAASNSSSLGNLRLIAQNYGVEHLRRHGLHHVVVDSSLSSSSSSSVGVRLGAFMATSQIIGLETVPPMDPSWLRPGCCVSTPSVIEGLLETPDDEHGLFPDVLEESNASTAPSHVIFGRQQGVNERHFEELTPLTKPSKLDDFSKQYTIHLSCRSRQPGSPWGVLQEYFTLSPATDPRSLATQKMLRTNTAAIEGGVLVNHYLYHALLRPGKRWVSHLSACIASSNTQSPATTAQECDVQLFRNIMTAARERLSTVAIDRGGGGGGGGGNYDVVVCAWKNAHIESNVATLSAVTAGSVLTSKVVNAVDELLISLLGSLGGGDTDNDVSSKTFSKEVANSIMGRIRPKFQTKSDLFCDVCYLPHGDGPCPNFQHLKVKKRDATKRGKGILPSLPGELVMIGSNVYTASDHVSVLARGSANYETFSASDAAIKAGYSQPADRDLLQKWLQREEPRPFEFRIILRTQPDITQSSQERIVGEKELNTNGCVFRGFRRKFPGHISVQSRPIASTPKGEVRPFGYFHTMLFHTLFQYVQPGRDSHTSPDALVIVAVNGVHVSNAAALKDLLQGRPTTTEARVPGWGVDAEGETSSGSVFCFTLWPQRYANAFGSFNSMIASGAEVGGGDATASSAKEDYPTPANTGGGGTPPSSPTPTQENAVQELQGEDPTTTTTTAAAASDLDVVSSIVKMNVVRTSSSAKWGIRLAGLRILPFKSSQTTGTHYSTSDQTITEQLLDYHTGFGIGFVDAPSLPPTAKSTSQQLVTDTQSSSSKVYLTDKVFLVRGVNGFRVSQHDISTILRGISTSGGGASSSGAEVVLRMALTLQRITLPTITLSMDPPTPDQRDSKIGLLVSTASGIVGRPPRGSMLHAAIQAQAPIWCNLRHDYLSLGTRLGGGSSSGSALEREYEDDDDDAAATASNGGAGQVSTRSIDTMQYLCSTVLSDPPNASPTLDDASFRVLAVNGVDNFSPNDLKRLMRDFKLGNSSLQLKLGMLVRAIPKHVPQN